MKDALEQLITDGQLEKKYMAMFYAKDFACIRQVEDKKVAEELKENPPTNEEIKQVIEQRKTDNPFGQ